ncbi:MAG: LPS export ABC transporter ATP-binding protein [Proteobacteria bacterium]|nr:LPS export ABC transporter ATP-binding protein [Pseudomonadota bacterium]
MAILTLEHLEKTYGGRKVVNDVNLQVESGKVTGLLGPNGAGKTTTFYMAVGIIRPDSGHVLINGSDITRDPMYVRARNGIGYLPQESSVFKTLTVKENVMVILELLSLTKSEQIKKTDQLLDELRIKHLSDQKAAVLSGGERRRLEITRVLATNPLFILLDEPFAGVDPIAVIDIQKIIGLLTQRNIGVLISDHNVRETLGVCDEAFIMNNGAVIETGSPEMIASSEIARKIYLGEEFRL